MYLYNDSSVRVGGLGRTIRYSVSDKLKDSPIIIF